MTRKSGSRYFDALRKAGGFIFTACGRVIYWLSQLSRFITRIRLAEQNGPICQGLSRIRFWESERTAWFVDDGAASCVDECHVGRFSGAESALAYECVSRQATVTIRQCGLAVARVGYATRRCYVAV